MPLTYKERVQNDMYQYLLRHPVEVLSICSGLSEGKVIPTLQKDMMMETIKSFIDNWYGVFDGNFESSWNISDFKDVFKMAHKQATMLLKVPEE